MHWKRKWQPTPVFLPGESQGWGSLVKQRFLTAFEVLTVQVFDVSFLFGQPLFITSQNEVFIVPGPCICLLFILLLAVWMFSVRITDVHRIHGGMRTEWPDA